MEKLCSSEILRCNMYVSLRGTQLVTVRPLKLVYPIRNGQSELVIYNIIPNPLKSRALTRCANARGRRELKRDR